MEARPPLRPVGHVGNNDVRLGFRNTRAYAGCPVTTRDPPAARAVVREVLVEFRDGVVAAANRAPAVDGELRVAVDAYCTARGSTIPARVWLLRPAPAGTGRYGVARRLTGAAT